MTSKKRIVKERSCEFVSNLASIAEIHDCVEEEAFKKITELITELKYVDGWAGIIHDLDVNDDGSLKAKHCHIVIKFKYPTTFEKFAHDINMPAQDICKIHTQRPWGNKMVADIGGALSYLTHRNDEEKYQYSDELVQSSGDWDWKTERNSYEKRKSNGSLGDIISKILDGTITEANLTEYIDCYTYSKNKKQILNIFEYRRNLVQSEHDRNMTVIYIYGCSGAGKTTMAKRFCEERKLKYYISGGSNDPFDGYRNEKAVIIDDARPDMFSPEEWLKILDPYTRTDVKSRYFNKNLNCEYMLLTSTIKLKDFFKAYPNEDPVQLYRRISLSLEMDKENVDVYLWDFILLDFLRYRTYPNPIKEFINQNGNNVDVNELIDSFNLKKDLEENKEEIKRENEKNDETI